MEDFQQYLLFTSLSFLLLFISFRYLINSKNQSRNLPPSPWGLPIIGHLHLLKHPVHRTLQTISKKLGPVYSLRLGHRHAVVVSSPSAAEECFTKHDRVLANRLQLKAAGKFLGYNYKSMLACPYGDELRTIRKVCTVDLLSAKRLNEFSGIRRDETHRLMKKIYTICGSSGQDFTRVQLRTLLFELTVNSMMRMVAGKRYYGESVESSEDAIKFDLIIKGFLSFTAFNNPGDFITILGWLDLWGFEKKAKALGKRMDSFLQDLIDEHRRGDLKSEDTMISHMLSLQSAEPEKYNDEVIKSLVQDLIFGGSETTVSTIEWAMSLLLNHRKQLEKAAAEINAEVGEDCLVDEQHLPKLHFLQCVILETLRLYGPGRLLLPHFSSEDCTIGGFDIPRGTTVFINAWAIQTDPQWWDNATEFEPERFETQQQKRTDQSEMYNYSYMPFGQGRRKCPGSGMANRVLGLVVASLIQCFEWKRVGDEEIDMSEGTDLSVSRALPLEAMCKPLGIINKALV